MIMITKENIEYEYPQERNNDLLVEKGFKIDDENNEYFKLLNNYKKLFESYLKEKLPLELIDDNMKSSDLKFVQIKEEDMDFYQISSTMGLDYIYLRNNLYIEKLSKEDLEFLSKKDNLDDEAREFIKRTYLTVINPYENDEKRIVFYGPENGKHLCDSTDVVLGIRYNEFETNGMSDEEFQKNFLEQLRLIAQVSTLLEIASPNELGSQVKVIQYNELSIMKKYNGNVK
ncbi:hypothetical protein [Candidatus Proelusimicrobium excrementi]|uniref:hypothetical protein n=1 Tax=Candidatus Proelusimicrobium excrementi TaxID=3416222 RepID=UPI003D09DE91